MKSQYDYFRPSFYAYGTSYGKTPKLIDTPAPPADLNRFKSVDSFQASTRFSSSPLNASGPDTPPRQEQPQTGVRALLGLLLQTFREANRQDKDIEINDKQEPHTTGQKTTGSDTSGGIAGTTGSVNPFTAGSPALRGPTLNLPGEDLFNPGGDDIQPEEMRLSNPVQDIEENQGIIVPVNSETLWGEANGGEIKHAVTVTGFDPLTQEFIVCENGRGKTTDKARRVPYDQMLAATGGEGTVLAEIADRPLG